MRLSLDELNDLEHAIEQEGGVRLEGTHEGRLISYSKPKKVEIRTQSCGHHTNFMIPYDVLNVTKKKGAIERGGGLVTVCAVCDHIPAMPRFEHVLNGPTITPDDEE